ncbi:hypothetical protein MRX96_035227 [Rhipicephalus microplus]
MHLKSRMKFCDAEGKFVKPKLAKPTSFSGGAATPTLSDSVTQVEALFAMSLTVKGVPFSFGDTAPRMFPVMFSDSKFAEKFSSGRSKASYIISDGLGPLFRKKEIGARCVLLD